jgi:hypothetical protein
MTDLLANKSGILSCRFSVSGGDPKTFSGKDSAWTPRIAGLTRIRVLHFENGAKDAGGFDMPKNTATQPAASKNRTISGSPSGAPSSVSFPPN